MTIFYFDYHDQDSAVRDSDGQELPNRAAAMAEAMLVLPELSSNHRAGTSFSAVIDVREGEHVFYTATLALAGHSPG